MTGDASSVNTKSGERGFILVTVLLGVALLAAIALALSHVSRLDLKGRHAAMRTQEARLLADGIVRVIASRLTEPEFLLRWRQVAVDGVAACQVPGAQVLLSVRDVGGIVDLNAAPAALLERLALGSGLAPERARALAAAIVDFRDSDDDPVPEGAEIDAYRAARLPHGPKNGPFESATELDQVLGVTHEVYRALRPFVTVHSRMPGLDPSTAPRRLLELLLGRQALPDATEAPRGEALPVEFTARSPARAFAVGVSVETSGGGRFSREAVVELAQTTAAGFLFRDWLLALHPVHAPFEGARQDCRTIASAQE